MQRWVDSGHPPPEWVEGSVHDQRTLVLTPEESAALIADLQVVLVRYSELSAERRDSGVAPEGAERVRSYLDVFPLLGQDG